MLLLPKWEQVIDSNVLFSMISTMGAIWATIILQRLLGGQKRRRELAKLGRQAVAERDGKAHTCLSLQSGATADWKKEDMQIAMLSCSELRMAMRKGKLSCERIMLAFCRRSHELGRLGVNAVTEELYDEALATARALDISGILLAKEEDPLKPLLGLPVSIKDSVDQEGCFSSCGLARLVHPEKRSKKDSVVVSLLRDAGAIPFVRTNTPQLLMMAETDNFVWGRTDNPWNTKRTPGGSSGGEAALVSLRASPLGLGSDIGGSIRIPSSFCGLTGFKPSPGRISRKGMAVPRMGGRSGQIAIKPVCGPLANKVEDCELMMRAFCQPAMWQMDSSVPPCPWDVSVAAAGNGKPLRIGYFTTDGWFEPCRSMTRAVHEAVVALEHAGHTVVPVTLPHSGWDVATSYYGIMGATGNMYDFIKGLEGENIHPLYRKLVLLCSIPNWARPLVSSVLRFAGRVRHSTLINLTRDGGLSTREYHEVIADTLHLVKEMSEFMEDYDALIFPPHALPALEHRGCVELTPIFSYMFLPNLLHWPAGVVPVTKVSQDEACYETTTLPENQRRCILSKIAEKHMRGAAGMPVCVQVMTKPFHDELCLFVMKELESGLASSRGNFVPPLAQGAQ